MVKKNREMLTSDKMLTLTSDKNVQLDKSCAQSDGQKPLKTLENDIKDVHM